MPVGLGILTGRMLFLSPNKRY